MSVYHNGQKVLNNITSVNEEAMKEIAKEVYSTEEQVVGTWIDGKPIYRKTFHVDAIGAGTISPINISSLNCSQFVKIYGWGHYKSKTGLRVPFLYTDGTYIFDGYASEDASILNITSKGVATYDIYITIEYTKTTDE